MSGIVGYHGQQSASAVLLAGLGRLESRGYDSVGLASVSREGLAVRRVVGRVADLAERVANDPVCGNVGIAHTRWATHGRPKLSNTHPHQDQAGRLALVHNGVIENHQAIRKFLQAQGVVFQSETDSEAIVQLIGFFLTQTGDLMESVRGALRQVRGAYGIVVISSDAPETLIAARCGSPLVVSVRDSEMIVASDVCALPPQFTQVVEIQEQEVIRLDPEGLSGVSLSARTVTRGREPDDLLDNGLGDFQDHMRKEIFEQPHSLENTLRGRVSPGADRIKLGAMDRFPQHRAQIQRVLLFGCGTSWNAALVGKYLLEEFAGISTTVEYSSELRYRNCIVEDGTLAIALSSSGETPDTIAALREVIFRGATSLGIVNDIGSTIARETDSGIYLHVGPEIGVASTKAFTAQLAALTMISLELGRRRHLSPESAMEFTQALHDIPKHVRRALELEPQVREIATQFVAAPNWLVLGNGVNLPVALEGALKLKEVGGVHAEGMPAAEMKHGPIAMVDEGMPVIVIATAQKYRDPLLANIDEVKNRGGRVIAITTGDDADVSERVDYVLPLNPIPNLFSPFLTCIPLQLLAYHSAIARGLDVDKVRNEQSDVAVQRLAS